MFCVPEDSHLQGCFASQFGYCTDDSVLVAKEDILLASCPLCCTTEKNAEVKLQVHPGGEYKDYCLVGVVPCSLVKIEGCFRCAYCFHHQSEKQVKETG
jgi:hypothetical protein